MVEDAVRNTIVVALDLLAEHIDEYGEPYSGVTLKQIEEALTVIGA